jgi:hypothetical protein
MKSITAIGAALIALGVGMTGPAGAMPQSQAPATSGDLVVKVQVDCHAGVRRHYLPEYDRRIWHRHRQSNCRVVIVDPPEDDDYEDRPRDCHRDVRRHYLDEYGGNVTHKHVGPSCRVRVYQRHSGDDSGGNCIRLGPITYCEN